MKAVTVLMAGAAVLSVPAHADTLQEALAKAYRTNPTLTAARAVQRATDEQVAIARSRALPSLGVTGGLNQALNSNPLTPDRTLSAGVSLGVPLYQGGGVRNGIRAADARIDAGRADLRDSESTLFAQVVGAYMDVIRDEAVVGLNRQNVEVLRVNLQATQDRFQVGDLTRTDVAQSQARLATAQAQFEQSEAQLVASRENYVRLVGDAPGVLQPPPPLPPLPASATEATQVALANNPALEGAKGQRLAARYDVSGARAGRLPRVSAVGSGNYSDYLGSLNVPGASQTNRSGAVGLSVSLPIFSGGLVGAQVRQAQAREAAAIETVTLVERNVVAQARSAFANYAAANAVIRSSEQAIAAASLSLEGVRAENTVGTRTIIEILNAQQELLNAQVNLVFARRNAYVAGFSLLAAMGKAEARDLGLEVGPLYDPVQNYNRIRGKIFDWGDDPAPQPVATRTVDTAPQTPAVTAQGPR